jgi:hypothetical protein
MKDEDFIVIIEKDSVTHTFKRILENYPSFCLHTDLATIRKIISIEKSRLKKKIIKEKEILSSGTPQKQEIQKHSDIETQLFLQEKNLPLSSLTTGDFICRLIKLFLFVDTYF